MKPRILITIPYGIARGPISVMTKIAHRLPADSYPRVAFDRALGSYDQFAGRLLEDDAIVRRGTLRASRSNELAEAVGLERQAAARREQADQVADAGHESAEEKRRAAKERAANALDVAEATERRGKREASARARSQAARTKQAVQARATSRATGVRQQAERVEKAAEARQSNARRGADAKLQDVTRTKATARQARADADRLGSLAEAKKAARKS